MAIKYKDFEKREQTRKDYIDKAAEAAKTQANEYTDEKIKNIPAPPAPDIPTALPQKYEAFKVQFVQGNVSSGENPAWQEYHKTLWSGNIALTTGTWDNSFITDTIIDYPKVRKYSLLLTVGGVEKELKYVSSSTEYNTYACTENGTVVLNAAVQRMNVRNNHYNNTTTVYVYCPTGSALIGQSLTAAHYGKKQYLYALMNPAAILQYPSEAENTRFLTMCQSIATKNAKLKLTLTDNVIEANYANISNELVTTDYVDEDGRIRWIGVVADRKPLKAGSDVTDDMPTCIKGILEVEYTDEEATKECVYDKIQGESYTFKIGDFNHDESSAFDYYFNGAALIPWDNAQMQATFAYRPVSGTEKSVQVKSMVNDGQMLPYFDISELFGQAANTVIVVITSNTAVENVDMGGRPVTTIALPSNIQNFTDANDEIMVSQILTLAPSSLPQTYKKKAVTLATSGWITGDKNLLTTTPLVGGSYSIISNVNFYGATQVEVNNETYWKDVTVSIDNMVLTFTSYSSTNHIASFGNFRITSPNVANKTINITYVDATTTKRVNYINKGNLIQYALTDSDVKTNSAVHFTLDEANGKLAGQFGLKKTIDKEAGKLTFTADTLPASAISGTLEIGDTSTEGAAFVEGITSETDTTGFVKATEENTFTKTQTFNGTESQAGIKTNAIDNENGNRVVYFNGEKQMFGSGAIPTQVRSSEQRLKLERPVSGGTGTEIVEVANLSDVVGGVTSLPQTYIKKGLSIVARTNAGSVIEWGNKIYIVPIATNITAGYAHMYSFPNTSFENSIFNMFSTKGTFTIEVVKNAPAGTVPATITETNEFSYEGYSEGTGHIWTSSNTTDKIIVKSDALVENALGIYYQNINEWLSITKGYYTYPEITSNQYVYPSPDIKINSEVRYTLDETYGKVAGNFGLKNRITKKEGVLIFTAATSPATTTTENDLNGTLEIGDTSTEGAAWVVGIIYPNSDNVVEPRFYRGNAFKWSGVAALSSGERDAIHIPYMTFTGSTTKLMAIGYADDWPYELSSVGTSADHVFGTKDGAIQFSNALNVTYKTVTSVVDGENVVYLSANVVDTEESTAVYNLSFDIYLKRKSTT